MPPPAEFINDHLSMCRAYHEHQQQQQRQLEYTTNTKQPPTVLLHCDHASRPQDMAYSPQHAHLLEATRDEASPWRTSAAAASTNLLPLDASVARYNLPEHDSDSHQTVHTLPVDSLVLDEDKLLLTDFIYYLMNQLQLVRFSETDRKTRGGKREKIKIGYGGLECIHCAHVPKSRKFFWSGVDRLANSFAEIPAHVMKCKECPDSVKEALTKLKEIHADQMARLPRGSQKVFFRRVWKRMHDDDPGETKAPPPARRTSSSSGSKQVSPSEYAKLASPANTNTSDESIFVLDRPTKESAKALAYSSMQEGPPSPLSRVLLAIPEDRDFLSDADCFVRRQIEVFCATKADAAVAQMEHKYPIHEGQVGIRCLHCSFSKTGNAAGHAVAYPYSINGIFESVREFQRLHLEFCDNLPLPTREKLASLSGSTTLTSIQRKYYVLAARGLGLRDSRNGIEAGAESVPVVAQAVFTFAECDTTLPEMEHEAAGQSLQQPDERKRPALLEDKDEYSPASKKRHSGDLESV
jgi:hypothetical protein